MFHWEILILPLIAFGVWILSTVFKSDPGDKNKAGSRGHEGAMGRRIPRKPKPPDRSRPEPVGRRDVPVGMESRPQLLPAAPPIIAPRRTAPTVAGPRRRVPILATVIEEPPPVVRQPAALVRAPEPLPILLPMQAAPESPAATAMAPPQRERPPSPVIQEVLRLLRSPKSAATAFVMREILDRRFGPRRR